MRHMIVLAMIACLCNMVAGQDLRKCVPAGTKSGQEFDIKIKGPFGVWIPVGEGKVDIASSSELKCMGQFSLVGRTGEFAFKLAKDDKEGDKVQYEFRVADLLKETGRKGFQQRGSELSIPATGKNDSTVVIRAVEGGERGIELEVVDAATMRMQFK
jgi:hypothetical protein